MYPMPSRIPSPVPSERARSAGFTLIEVMAALAILGTALLILLDNHYKAMRLHNETRDAETSATLLERAVGIAEVDVQTGKLEGNGDFGPRQPGYSYAYTASPVQQEQGIPLYSVRVTLTAPEDTREITLLVYYTGVPEDGASGASPPQRKKT